MILGSLFQETFFFFDTMGKTVTEILGDDVIQGFVTGRYFYDINKRDR